MLNTLFIWALGTAFSCPVLATDHYMGSQGFYSALGRAAVSPDQEESGFRILFTDLEGRTVRGTLDFDTFLTLIRGTEIELQIQFQTTLPNGRKQILRRLTTQITQDGETSFQVQIRNKQDRHPSSGKLLLIDKQLIISGGDADRLHQRLDSLILSGDLR
jgi:hypothetical protein